MLIGGIAIQAEQANSYYYKKQHRIIKKHALLFPFLTVLIIVLITGYFLRASERNFIMALTVGVLMVLSQRIHSSFGLLLQNNNSKLYALLNSAWAILTLILIVICFISTISFQSYLFASTLSSLIFYIANQKKLNLELSFRSWQLVTIQKIPVLCFWLLISFDLLFAARFMDAENARIYFYASMAARFIQIIYFSIYYTNKRSSYRRIIIFCSSMNALSLIFLIVVFRVSAIFEIPFLTSILDSIPKKVIYMGILFGNIQGIFLLSTQKYLNPIMNYFVAAMIMFILLATGIIYNFFGPDSISAIMFLLSNIGIISFMTVCSFLVTRIFK